MFHCHGVIGLRRESYGCSLEIALDQEFAVGGNLYLPRNRQSFSFLVASHPLVSVCLPGPTRQEQTLILVYTTAEIWDVCGRPSIGDSGLIHEIHCIGYVA